MPGVYVGQRDFYIAIDAPADGTVNRGGSGWLPVKKGERVELRYGQALKVGTLTVKFSEVTKENRPVMTLTNER